VPRRRLALSIFTHRTRHGCRAVAGKSTVAFWSPCAASGRRAKSSLVKPRLLRSLGHCRRARPPFLIPIRSRMSTLLAKPDDKLRRRLASAWPRPLEYAQRIADQGQTSPACASSWCAIPLPQVPRGQAKRPPQARSEPWTSVSPTLFSMEVTEIEAGARMSYRDGKWILARLRSSQ
jgi:hypothetical protein